MKVEKEEKKFRIGTGRDLPGKALFSLLHIFWYVGCGILCTGCGAEEKVPLSAAVSLSGEAEMPAADAEMPRTSDNSALNEKADESENEDDADGIPLLEQLFTYEKDGYGDDSYLVITGIAEEYEDNFWQYIEEIRDNYGSKWYLIMPSEVNGIPVREIAEDAFADRQMYGVQFPDTMERIGEGPFGMPG